MLKISFATNIAMHAMGLLASQQQGCCLTAAQMGGHLGVSENHITKIMQRLSRAGLVTSKRGPKGGFGLARDKRDVRLMDIYEAMEGPWQERLCMLAQPVCQGNECLMGELLGSILQQVRSHFISTTLASLDWAHLDLVSHSRDLEPK